MSAVTAAELLTTLRQLQFLQPQQLDELGRNPQAGDLDARASARKLIDIGWLTPYQANQLLQAGGKGLVIGSYVLLERLGEGGMGQVFKARHLKLDRVVALKLIHKERLEHPQAVKRFRREIQAAAALSHPNIVLAFDADQSGTAHFLTMEYVEGADLARLVKDKGPLPIADACECIRQVALGLQHAFEKGMVHRDIKPQNLLCDRKGGIKILDLGLARFARPDREEESTSTLTREGSVMGTLDYIAPEQAIDSHTVDIRADLYSLGCTFYFLLTGRVPFPGGDALAKLKKHESAEPVPVEQLRPDVPPGVAAVVRKLMAKKPADRFQTPAELAAAPACGTAPVAALAYERKASNGAGARNPGEATTITAATLALARSSSRRGRWLAVSGVGLMVLCGLLLLTLRSGPSSHSVRSSAEPKEPPKEYRNPLGMEFVRVPRGRFLMGGGGGKVGSREVEIPYDFYLGKYEVTQGDWQAVTGTNPSFFSRGGEGRGEVATIGADDLKRFPVEQVSWDDAQRFLKLLNEQDRQPGWVYRLPTEAEWEYACRGGPGSDPFEYAANFYLAKPTNELLPALANFKGVWNRTCKVGSYPANRLGLHDMHGNVWEWCDDEGKTLEGEPGRRFRGGSWLDEAEICAAAVGNAFPPSDQFNNFGLRVARAPVR